MKSNKIVNHLYNKINIKFLKTMVLFFSVYLILTSISPFSSRNRIKHDLVSWALPAQAALNNQGVAYVDYWDIKAPGLVIITQAWILIFGISYLSFMGLHLLLISISIFGIIKLWYVIFDKWTASWISIVSAILFLSPSIQTQFAGAELYGLAFCITALNLIIPYSKTNSFKIFVASFLFVSSGQMKEPFIFTALSIVPLLAQCYLTKNNKFKKYLIAFVFGGIIATSIIIGYLLHYNNFDAYKQVLVYKQSLFLHFSNQELFNHFIYTINYSSKNLFAFNFPLTLTFLIVVSMYVLINMQKLNRFTRSHKTNNPLTLKGLCKKYSEDYFVEVLVLITFSLATFLGMALQFRYPAHYIIPIVFSTIVISTLLLEPFRCKLLENNHIKSKKHLVVKVLLYIIVLLIITFPKANFIKGFYSNKESVNQLTDFQFYNLNVTLLPEEKIIINTTHRSDCIMSIYGWAVGSNYFYTNRKPCTRFFLPHVMPDKYNKEYANSLINNVPAAIMYSRENADFNIEVFEKNVFNYSDVLSECYSKDREYGDLYFPKYNKDKMRECILKNYK